MTSTADRAAFAYIGAFVDELARAGVRHVCIAPGSRSTPLALTIARHPTLRTWMHLDERSAAFFALGMARGLGEPVALLCTSGTAAANFFPAVVEARSAGVPLLVFTADRPPELRDAGAAQTIDQQHLYGVHAKWFVEVALPDTTPALLRYARTLAARAAAVAAMAPSGPVHLNFPFREPLVPVPVTPPDDLTTADLLAWRGRPNGEPWVRVTTAPTCMTDGDARRSAAQLGAARRPLIVCGPQPDEALAAPLAALALAVGAPLIADPVSQLRWGTHDRRALIDRYDAALRHERTAEALAPDFVLRVGGVTTSRPLMDFLRRHSSAPLMIVDAARWPEPTHLATEVVHADPREVCAQLLAALGFPGKAPRSGDGWLDEWRRLNSLTADALDRFTASLAEPFEGRALADVVTSLPSAATLFVSSSMPIRDLDAFGAGDARRIRVLANRGANGIDGVVSTALGAAAGGDAKTGPLVLVIGDIAMYHDMNGLLAAKRHTLDMTVVVLNNDGGGIFSFLPQAAEHTHFEALFGTPHGLDFAPVAEMYGARYVLAADSEALRRGVAAGVTGRGLHLVEFRTDRVRNVALHREAWSAVARALDDA
ncbi:MAG: 2-succinyl-5-enolpyruvyl-6-hydroxy-3-cyclohexene-1-carboxylic-acid synthase [Gemmatimonadaceae bacterium]|nr:2-succinyl-5-enolpyruvyl-6-hydroxy-3-cyclohexene-1-carboxylic-acid synthase [Gemmatimonadaceae bacterium]